MRSTRTLTVPAIVIVLLIITAIGVGAQSAGQTLTVAQDGSGDFETITAAIEAASDGDTILVASGTYAEGLEIRMAITLAGDAPREQVIIAPELDDLPDRELNWSDDLPVVIYVEGTDSVIEHLTIMGGDEVPALWLVGGQHVVRDVATEGMLGVREEADAVIEDSALQFTTYALDARGVVRNNMLSDALFLNEGASVDIEGNTFLLGDGPPGIAIIGPTTSARVRNNTIEGGGVGIVADFSEEALLEGNTIMGSETGIVLVETASVARHNTISDVKEAGILVVGDGALVEDNTVVGGRMGVHAEPDPEVADMPDLDERPRIEGNTISGASHFGIVVDQSRPSVSGNTICAGREPLKIIGDADPQIGTNEICENEES